MRKTSKLFIMLVVIVFAFMACELTPKDFTVTFNSNEGLTVNNQLITENNLVIEPSNPTRTGYTFAGWFKEATLTNLWNFSNDQVTMDLTLFAKWDSIMGTCGEAGGLIFYDKGSYSDGWRYLEAAPSGWYTGSTDSMGVYSGSEDPLFQWGIFGQSVTPSATAIISGSGTTNTENIVSFHDGLVNYYTNPTAYNPFLDGTVAAKICSDFFLIKDSITYGDWYLPSKDELHAIYTNLAMNNKGGFYNGINWTRYWSSSELNSTSTYSEDLVSNSQLNSGKDSKFRVRPIRAY